MDTPQSVTVIIFVEIYDQPKINKVIHKWNQGKQKMTIATW